MREIILINAHIETIEKEDNLRELIKSIKKEGFDICLITHTNVPKDIIDRVDYFIYDKENPMLDKIDVQYWGYYSLSNSTTDNFKFYYKSKDAKIHYFAYYRLIFGGLNYLKSMGYGIVHSIDYDIHFESFKEIDDNTKLLDKYDIIYYNRQDNTPVTPFSVRLDKIDFNKMVYNEDKLYNIYEKYFNNVTLPILENILFDEFLSFENVKIKSFEELEKTIICNTERFVKKKSFFFRPYKEGNKLMSFFINLSDKPIKLQLIYNDVKLSTYELVGGMWTIRYIGNFDEIKIIKVYINDDLHDKYDFNKTDDVDLVTKWVKVEK